MLISRHRICENAVLVPSGGKEDILCVGSCLIISPVHDIGLAEHIEVSARTGYHSIIHEFLDGRVDLALLYGGPDVVTILCLPLVKLLLGHYAIIIRNTGM